MPNPSLGKGGFSNPQVTKYNVDDLLGPKFVCPALFASHISFGKSGSGNVGRVGVDAEQCKNSF